MSERNKHNGKILSRTRETGNTMGQYHPRLRKERPWTPTLKGPLPSFSHAPSQGVGSLGVNGSCPPGPHMFHACVCMKPSRPLKYLDI